MNTEVKYLINIFFIIIYSLNINAQKNIDGNSIFIKKHFDTYKVISDCLYNGIDIKSKKFYQKRLSKNQKKPQKRYVFINRKTGRYGIINGKGKVIEKPKYEFFNKDYFLKYYFAFKENCWYIFNDSLEQISKCEYDDFDCSLHFSNYILVKKDNKWGVIDSNNKVVITSKYDKLDFIGTGRLLQFKLGNKYGLITIEGKKVYETDIPFYFTQDVRLKEINCRNIMVNNKTGLILKDDTLLIKPEYDAILPINFTYRTEVSPNQLAFLLIKNKKAGLFYNKNIIVDIGSLKKDNNIINKYVYIFEENGKKGIINLNKNDLIKYDAVYDSLYYLIPKYGIHYIEKMPIAAKINNKWGVIDNNTNQIIKFEYDTIALLSLFHKNLKKYYFFIVGKGGKYGIINEKNEIIYDIALTDIFPIDDYRFLGRKNNKYGLINTNGELLFDFELDSIKNIEDWDKWRGLNYFFAVKNGKIGMLKKSGEVLFDFKLSEVKNFNRDYFLCKLDNKYGIINKIGDIVLDFEYSELYQGGNGFFIGKKNNKYGLINPDGTVVYGFELSEIKNLKYTGNFKVKKTNKYGLIDRKGNLLLNFEFDDIITVVKASNYRYFAIAIKNGKYGLIQIQYVHPRNIKKLQKLQNELKKEHSDYLTSIIRVNGKTEIPFEYDKINELEHSKVLLKKANKYEVYDIEDKKIYRAKKIKENSKTVILYGEKGKIVLDIKKK